MVHTLAMLVCVLLPGCAGTNGWAPKVVCNAHEIAVGLGPADDPGIGFTLDEALATIDTVQSVDAVPATELGGTTTTWTADIRISFISDIRHVEYEPPCGSLEGLEADVDVQVDLGTWLHGEVETTLAVIGIDLDGIWFGRVLDGQSFDTFDLDPATLADLVAYDPTGCGSPPAAVTGVLRANWSNELLYVATERCDGSWHDYTVYPNVEVPAASSTKPAEPPTARAPRHP